MDYGILARSYNTLHYEGQLKKVLSSFYRDLSFDGLSKYALHQTVNDALIRNYSGEEILKYKLAQFFRLKDYTAAFEVRAKSSRADFLVINGETKCFEIKSKIDTLKRLEKQSCDYKDVFEFNTIVTDQKHLSIVKDIIPDYYGIWSFEGHEKVEFRKAQKSVHLDSSSQLDLMTKRERKIYFDLSEIDQILLDFSKDSINEILKGALKDRYKDRWLFVKSNWDKILPIDLQFFYNTNINPDLIYSI